MELNEEWLRITRDELASFCDHSSRDLSRPHLSSVCVDLSVGRVAATDGHRLLAWTSGKVGERKILLPAAGLRAVLAIREPRKPRPLGARKRNGISTPRPAPTLNFAFGVSETRVSVAGLTVLLPHVNALFPPVEQVIPTYAQGAPCSCVAINPALFADLARIAKVVDARLPSVVVQPGPTDIDPVLVRFARDDKWLAVLMPMRCEGTYSAASRGVAAA